MSSATPTSSVLPSYSSADSLSLSDILASSDLPDLSLTASSISLSTLSVASSSGSVPDFLEVSQRRSSLSTALDASVVNPPILLDVSSSSLRMDNTTATIPTTPRLRNIARTELSIKKWAEKNTSSDPPGHVPWNNFDETEASSWIPEGSVYPRDNFRDALSQARNTPKQRLLAHKPSPRRASRRSEFRNALVYQKEIIVQKEGRTKRCTLQGPVEDMNEDMADMLQELRDLNAYFKNGSEASISPAVSAENIRPCMDPPSLMISNSHAMMPLSLESTGTLGPRSSTPLASRRGKLLPSLQIKDVKDAKVVSELYPGLPSAFLGTPSSYNPTFDPTLTTRGSSMNLEDMLTSLRSQCASFQTKPNRDARTDESKVLSPISPLTPSTSNSDRVPDDEWAFADGLLHQYGLTKLEDESPLTKLAFPSKSPSLAESPAHDYEKPVPLVDTSPEIGGESPSLDVSAVSSASFGCSPSDSTRSSSPRGILKRCKSVRFASQADVAVVEHVPTPSPPRHSTGSSEKLRARFRFRKNSFTSARLSLPAKSAPARPTNPTPSDVTNAGPEPFGGRRRSSTAPSTTTPTRTSIPAATPKKSALVKRSSAMTERQQSPDENTPASTPALPSSKPTTPAPSSARRSLSRVLTLRKLSTPTPKDPRPSPRASLPVSTIPRRSMGPDTPGSRRGTASLALASTRETTEQKRVPLHSILARWK